MSGVSFWEGLIVGILVAAVISQLVKAIRLERKVIRGASLKKKPSEDVWQREGIEIRKAPDYSRHEGIPIGYVIYRGVYRGDIKLIPEPDVDDDVPYYVHQTEDGEVLYHRGEWHQKFFDLDGNPDVYEAEPDGTIIRRGW